jgi:Gram-negative bacterial TonB protein C-terminal
MKAVLVVGLMVVAAANAEARQDQLDAAKDLYASAAYEEALSTLSRLSEGGVSAPAVARQVDEYRAFCLYALGRTAEAESMAESIIRREPLAELNSADASPRVEAMFAGVRKRILPSLIRDQYRKILGLITDKQFAAAEPRLVEVRSLLTTAERIGAWDERLADISVLVDGFLALARANASLVPAVAAVKEATAAPPPPTPAFVLAEAVPATSGTIGEPRTYSGEDADVRPPIPIFQRSPSVPVELLTFLRTPRKPTVLAVTIDEDGNVLKADVRVSANTSFDALLVRAAGAWKYKPAIKDGKPVRYEKIVVVDVK